MKVSVIMPTYNRPEYFGLAVESFLSQKMCIDSELIVIINGNKDGYKFPIDERISYVESVHNSEAYAMNLGCLVAKGEVITILHDDDLFYDDDSLQNRVNPFIINNDIDVVYTQYQTIDKDGRTTSDVRDCGNVSLRKLLDKEYIYMPSMAWRREVTKAISFDESMHNYMDSLFKFQCLYEFNVMPVRKPTLKYRVHDGQVSLKSATDGTNKIEKCQYREAVRKILGDNL